MNEQKTWITNLPKIGIRPIIDGRYSGGIRDSLEDQVMNMAKAAKDLITKEIKYPNGDPLSVFAVDVSEGF